MLDILTTVASEAKQRNHWWSEGHAYQITLLVTLLKLKRYEIVIPLLDTTMLPSPDILMHWLPEVIAQDDLEGFKILYHHCEKLGFWKGISPWPRSGMFKCKPYYFARESADKDIFHFHVLLTCVQYQAIEIFQYFLPLHRKVLKCNFDVDYECKGVGTLTNHLFTPNPCVHTLMQALQEENSPTYHQVCSMLASRLFGRREPYSPPKDDVLLRMFLRYPGKRPQTLRGEGVKRVAEIYPHYCRLLNEDIDLDVCSDIRGLIQEYVVKTKMEFAAWVLEWPFV